MNPQPLRYAISDRNARAGDGLVRLVGQARRLAAEGIEFLQLREKDLEAGELASLARALLWEFRNSGTKLLVNGRPDVAIAVGADGVHLTSHREELTASQVHRLYAEAGLASPLVTVSCHSIEEVRRQRQEPVTAMLFGPVFEKRVRAERVAEGTGIDLLREACRIAAPVPVLALGGVNAGNAGECMEAGARGYAGIRLFENDQAG